MSALDLLRRAPAAAESLEDVLADLVRYGQPILCVLKGHGWWCRVEMNVTTAGADYRVQSECKHAAPLDAALECRDRVQRAVASRGAP